MEIMASQLSWVILSLIFAAVPHGPGTTGHADFTWVEYRLGDQAVQCSGGVSFDATPGKEKLRLRKICGPGARQQIEEVLVRLDRHQLIEFDTQAQTWREVDKPQSLAANLEQILSMSQPLRPWTPLLDGSSGRPDDMQGWWTRIQPTRQMLPGSLHYSRIDGSLSVFFDGKLMPVDAKIFEVPPGYRPAN